MANNTVEVRLATPADAVTVAQLQYAMYREQGSDDEQGFVGRFTKAWLSDLERTPTWLAELDGRPIGLQILNVVDKLPRPDQAVSRWAHGELLYVDEVARNLGIGRRLLDAMAEWAIANRVERIQCNASPDAVRLYQRVGFESPRARFMELRF